MNTSPDAPPPKPVITLADFDSPEAWREDLVKRLTEELSKRLTAETTRAPYLYSEDQTHQLGDLDSEALEKLLLGKVYDVESEAFEDNGDDYLYELDTTAIKSEANSLFNDWDEEIEALAEALEEDPESMKEEWLESDEFSRTELEAYLHSYDHSYRGEIAATAELDCSLSLNPEEDDLWECLTLFRINASDFLAMAKKEIADECADADGKLSDQDVAVWGLCEDDNDEDEPASAADIYERKFLEAQALEQQSRLHGFNECIPGNEVITANELSAYVKANAYGSQTKITTHLQLCLGPQTIKDFSTQCSRHEFHEKDLPVTILTGYLSSDGSPGFVKDATCIRLRKPLELPLSLIGINSNDSPERGEDSLLLPPDQQLYADLYETLVMAPCSQKTTYGTQMSQKTVSAEAEQKLIFEKAVKHLTQAPRWAVQSIDCERSFSEFLPTLQAYLEATNGPSAQNELDRELLNQVQKMDLDTVKPHEKRKIDLLLKLGAQGDLANGAGANAFQIAASKRLPLTLLEALHQVTTVPAAALPNGNNAFDLAVKSASNRGRLWNDEKIQEQVTHLSWFLERGIEPQDKALAYPKPGILRQIESFDDGPLMIAVLNALERRVGYPTVQPIKDRMLFEAAIQLREPLMARLLAAGANVDAPATLQLAGKPLEQAIEDSPHFYKRSDDQIKLAESCKAMVRSVRLRTSAIALIAEMDNEACAPSHPRP